MVGDISHGILQPFAKACPGRYFNIGICEPTIVNMAAGIAKTGLIPVVHTIAPFIIERAYEQIKLDFGYQKLGINLISVGSAFDYSQLGCSHHCYTDISLMSHFKRSHIFFPASPIELNVLFKSVYRNGEINYFRLPEQPHEVVFSPDAIQVGKAIRIAEGKDLTIVVIGPQLKTVVEALPILKQRGITADVLYYPTLKPFDEALLLSSLRVTHKVLVIEEASAHDGVFTSVLKTSKHVPAVEYAQIAIDDFVHEYGSYKDLCEKLGFCVSGIVAKIEHSFSFEQRLLTL
jgi:transketolase